MFTTLNNVVCEYKGIADTKPTVSNVFSNVNPRFSRRFTIVTALGKTRNYSRVEVLDSFFRRV